VTAAVDALRCTGLDVGYGPRRVLHALDLAVGSAEAVALLGPSGCGKTTLLSAVAGFVDPWAGRITIAGEVVADGRRSLPPERRGVGVVFQNYALWPHLSALDIVAYPLRRAGRGRAAARREAQALLDRMGVGALAASRPAELSGGEQQRVGVARALARAAPLYLFDEPTAHLDTALRAVLQEELAAQREALGAAVLYATHDVAEALAIADRVALVRDGALVQVAAPAEVYERPVDRWAARLTGPASVLELPLVGGESRAGTVDVDVAGTRVAVTGQPRQPGRAAVLVRPEWARLGGRLPGRVAAARFRGPHTDYRLDTPVGPVEVREPGTPQARVGDAPGWDLRRGWVLPGETGPRPGQLSRSPAPDPSAPPARSRS